MGRISCAAVVAAAVVGTGFAAAQPAMAATTGLVAAYGFDEGTGTTVTDASGNGNTGTANTWSYLTETYDGSTLKLYVNGTQTTARTRPRRRSPGR
jgi:Spy/CpxP family protein refolding chaperone